MLNTPLLPSHRTTTPHLAALDSARDRRRARRRALALASTFAMSLLPASASALLELELDVERIESSISIDTILAKPPGPFQPIDPIAPISGNCVLHPDEACVGGPGQRRLLRFGVRVHNRGDEDIVIGDPLTLPDLFKFSACHGHHHFAQAADYALLDSSGAVVAQGHKQGFCLEDTVPTDRNTTWPRRYDCKYQGIQVGYSDDYPPQLDCQWIDITDVKPGPYTIHVAWNPQGLIPDTNFENNQAYVPVLIPEPESQAPVVEAIWAPAAGTALRADTLAWVRWSARDDESVESQEVWLSLNNGMTWTQLVGDLPGGQGWYAFRVPPFATAHARLRVVARDGEATRGESVTAKFKIERPNSRAGLRGLTPALIDIEGPARRGLSRDERG